MSKEEEKIKNPLNQNKESDYKKLADSDIIKWLEEESGKGDSERKVSKKTEKRIIKKVLAYSATFMILSTGSFIALGETGHLPEPAQVWYDAKSEEIRGTFGMEETSEGPTVVAENLTEESKPEEFTGMEFEGLNHVWQNNRWEYVDPNDGAVAGFWNEEEGKYEHTAKILKGDWLGLFTAKFPQEIEKISSRQEWTEESWQSGETKIPLPFMITKGGTIEEIETSALNNRAVILAVSDLPAGKTDVLSPIGQPDDIFGGPSATGETSSITIIEKGIRLTFGFASQEAGEKFTHEIEIQVAMGDKEIKLGTKLSELPNEILSSPKLKLLSPLLGRNKYQLLLSVDNPRTGNPLNFSFKNLLTDEEGRFVLMLPALNLEDDSANNKK